MLGAAVLGLLLTMPVAGHEPGEEAVLEPDTYLNHVMVHEGELAPGAWENTTLAFGGTPLRGWWFLLFSGRVDGTVEATVVHDNATVAAWTWTTDQADMHVFRLNDTGFHELRLHNPGPHNATYRMFFDNTCDCSSKAALMQESPLWFNYNITTPGRVGLEFAVVPFTGPPALQDPPPLGDVRLHATVATWNGGSDAWPDGFEVVREHDVLFTGLDEDWGTFDLDFRADDNATYYILVTLEHESDEAWRFQVRPVIEMPEGKEAPFAGLPGVVLVVAVGLMRRRERS